MEVGLGGIRTWARIDFLVVLILVLMEVGLGAINIYQLTSKT